MMQVVPAAIGPDVGADRVGAEPARDPRVHAGAGRQPPVRRLVHQDHEPELPGPDRRDGQDQRDGRRPGDVQRHRADDHGPRVQHEPRPAQARHPAQVAKLGQGQDIPGDERCGRIGHAGIIAERACGRRAPRSRRLRSQKTITSRPRVPPACILRCASAARSGGKVSATRRVRRPSATSRPSRSSAS